jgi:hypothetical protein
VSGRNEWLGIFNEDGLELPQAVFQIGDSFLLRVGSPAHVLLISWYAELFTIQVVSRTLVKVYVPKRVQDGNQGHQFFGRLLRIRICKIKRGPTKTKLQLYSVKFPNCGGIR